MKQISRAIRRALDRNDMSQQDLAQMSRIEPSVISRLLSTDLRVSRDTLDGLLLAFPEMVDRYEIVQAHIHDEISPAAREVIDVIPANKARIRRKALNAGSLAATGEEALRYLLQNPHAVEDIFIDLARALGWRPGRKTKPATPPQQHKLIA